jgi:hypothetical protein
VFRHYLESSAALKNGLSFVIGIMIGAFMMLVSQ